MINKLFFSTTLIMCSLFCSKLNSQSYFSVQTSGSYWQHTELFGAGIGVGYQYSKNRTKAILAYDFGYGYNDRLEKLNPRFFPTIETIEFSIDNWQTLEMKSDYAIQHQLSLGSQFYLSKNTNSKNQLYIGVGVFAAMVKHFYTFTVKEIYHLDIIPITLPGPYDYVPFSHQTFMTLGGNVTLGLDREIKNCIWSPHLTLGIGGRYSSYLSFGVKVSKQVERKD